MSIDARRHTLVLGILALAFALPALAGQPAAGRLDSITPPAAAPGERVVITGRGLGARNVRIIVGDAPAQVVTATGNSATFVVPGSARIGATTVTAINPGGQTGSIGFHVRPAVQLDAAAAVSKVVGENGGVLVSRRNGVTYALSIPAAALTAPAQITMTPVASITNLPFSGPVHAAVRFEPSGLQLVLPATLEITVDRGIDPAGLFGFQLDEGGARLDVRPLALGGSTLTLRVTHFSYGGGATGTLADFEAQVRPALNALPAVASPRQAESLVSMVVTWIGMFGFDVCSQTDLCTRVVGVARRSMTANRDLACAQAAALVASGEPFLAHQRVAQVAALGGGLVHLAFQADSAGIPGFDVSDIDLSCVGTRLEDIIDLAKAQAIANFRGGLAHLLLEIASEATRLALDDVTAKALGALRDVVDSVLTQAESLCSTDPDAGEALIDRILGVLSIEAIDALDDTLDERLQATYAGCRIRIEPLSPIVDLEAQVQLTGLTNGLTPPGVSWSLEGATLGSSIDPQSGLFTAGTVTGSVRVMATSLADSSRFAKTVVTIIERRVIVSPSSANVDEGETVTFSASVEGLTDPTVTWSVSGGGTIDPNTGIFTAGSSAGSFTVRATSVTAPSVFGEATITVEASGTILSGQLHVVATFQGARTSREEHSAFVRLRVRPNGLLAVEGMTGTSSSTLKSGDCLLNANNATIIGGFVDVFGNPPLVNLSTLRVGTVVIFQDCTQPVDAISVTGKAGGFLGRAIVREGKIVEVDFNLHEVNSHPTGTERIDQEGRLVPER